MQLIAIHNVSVHQQAGTFRGKEIERIKKNLQYKEINWDKNFNIRKI